MTTTNSRQETETHYYGWNLRTKSYGWIEKTKIEVIDYSNKSVGFRYAHNNVMFRWNRSHSVAERFLAQHRHEYQIISRYWSTARPTAKWMAD
jgi:hypothetical protein